MAGRVVLAFAAILAAGVVVSGLPQPTPIDRSLPFVAILIAILAWTAGRLEGLVQAMLPVLVFFAVVPEERPRLLAYGAILGFGAVAAAWGLRGSEPSEKRSLQWVALVVVLTIALRAVPAPADALVAIALLLAGVAALAVQFESQDLAWHALPLILATGLVTPLLPVRASLFPLMLACLILFLRKGSLAALAGSVVLAIAAGRWAMLLVAIGALPVLIRVALDRKSRSGAAMMAIPLLSGSWTVAARFAAFAPSAAVDAFSSGHGPAISALLVALISIALRPALAAMYLLAAMVLVLPVVASPLRQRLAVPSAWFAAMWLVLFSWSGALPPSFPLPAPLLAVLGLSALLTIPLLVRPSWISGAIGAAMFVTLLAICPASGGEVQMIGEALRPGESLLIPPEREASAVTLVVSGANVSALRPGTSLGFVELVDETGRGYRRAFRLGEVADWGAFRPGHFFATQNIAPGTGPFIAGYGSSAYLAGWSRIPLTLQRPIATLRVTASPTLPPNAVLQLHQLEWPPQ